MKKAILILTCILLSSHTFSQGYISAKKSRCKKGLEKFLAKNNYTAAIQETDSTLELHVRDSTVRPFDIVLSFDNKGRCVREYKKVDCDSCFDKWLNAALQYKHLKWKKLGENEWVSQIYMKRRMIAHPSSYSILITREVWTQKEYDQMVGRN